MPEARDTSWRRTHFLRGVRLGTPIFLGYLAIGTAFGIVAQGLGFSVLQAATCSATALAGAGQFIALSMMRAGEGLTAVLIATTVVNLRYVLFGATMSPHMRGRPLRHQALLSFLLTDETFAVNMGDLRSGSSTGTSQAGVGMTAWAGWVGGTAIGAAAGTVIGDPTRWGVDFAMAAMFTALFFGLAEDWRHVVTGLFAGAVALGLPALAAFGIGIGSAWFIIISSMLAATLATLVFRERPAMPQAGDVP